jgi:hypothetical protein
MTEGCQGGLGFDHLLPEGGSHRISRAHTGTIPTTHCPAPDKKYEDEREEKGEGHERVQALSPGGLDDGRFSLLVLNGI